MCYFSKLEHIAPYKAKNKTNLHMHAHTHTQVNRTAGRDFRNDLKEM